MHRMMARLLSGLAAVALAGTTCKGAGPGTSDAATPPVDEGSMEDAAGVGGDPGADEEGMADLLDRPCPVDVAPGPGVAVTQQGAVRGTVSDGVTRWLGIPYAKPPVGDLRFRPPEDPDCWAGIRDTTAYGDKCLQKEFAQGQPQGQRVGSEDCLTLNVFAPESPTAPLPVLVFLHGGGNVAGSASEKVGGALLYDGALLAREQGVVVVTVQYRLGPLGFLALPVLSARTGYGGSGNWGLMDQVHALRWVQRNIAAFGGDPGRVLVFGESAGAVDTCAMLTSPLARGLFHAALMESGGCNAAPLARREEEGARYLEAVGCGGAADPLACLAELTPEQIVAPLEQPFREGIAGGGGFGPTVDGHVLPQAPLDILAAGEHNHVPFVIGSNADETAFSVPEGSVTPGDVRAFFALFGPFAADLEALYPPGDTPEAARAAYIQATTDGQFTCPTRTVARSVAKTQPEPVFRYFFTHSAPPRLGQELGAFHGLELFYVFGSLQTWMGGLAVRPEDRAVAGLMQRAWTRLAASGDPNGGTDPTWPAYRTSADNALEIAPAPAVREGIRTQKCDLMDRISAWLAGGP